MSLEALNWILAFVTLPGFVMAGAVLGGRTKPFISYKLDTTIIAGSGLLWIAGALNTIAHFVFV